VVIQVENLVKTYGQIKAVDGISFQVNRGDVFGMLGPNGAGKTTTVEILEGLRTADSGRATILGMDIKKSANIIKQKIGIQLQAPALLPLLNVEELLTTFASFYQNHISVKQALDLVGLQENKKIVVKNLSGGQQQRLSVAMSLINDPEIAFLDEPTTGLDPQARRALWLVIEGMRDKGKTVFLTTHYMEEAERLCNRLVIIDHGRIIAEGSPAELIRNNFAEKAIEFETKTPIPEVLLKSFKGVTRIAKEDGITLLYSSDVTVTISTLLEFTDNNSETGQLTNLHIREATLEDVFLKLTGRKIRD
jgi:ABC-2 type transport system ATP-binding protein